jgi:vancomycin resistance protein YoaR
VTSSLQLAIALVEPEITTGEVNDFGIEDILGVGYSSYKGSPTNRIKNIRFAVTKKLNGILVKPGETFSMLNALKPFTEEGGYLPELVIKGDRIKPEVGGGLCQVGSTMFRAAMNSGLDIVERRNHSLVVNYYNDHRNKMPGADATIYDPAPDFKFKNDTAGNILIMTDMNEKTQELFFTLWGKSDGRKGYYDPPTLHNWIPTGPAKDIITDELPEGKKKCQEPHPGAVASLKYHRELPSGELVTRVFESHYRPLPRICLIGGTPTATADGQTTTPTPGAIIPAPGPADIPVLVE